MSKTICVEWGESQDENDIGRNLCITRGDTLFEVKVTSEGIIIDVYSTDDRCEFVGSPFSATYEEMEFEADVHAALNHVESEATKKDT